MRQVDELGSLVVNRLSRLIELIHAAADRLNFQSQRMEILEDAEVVATYRTRLSGALNTKSYSEVANAARAISGINKGLGDRVWTTSELELNDVMSDLLKLSFALISAVETEGAA